MDIIYLSAKAQAELIREKKISSEELISLHFNRIKEVNPKINALVKLFEEKAIQQAQKADRAVAKNKRLPPLHGVPFTIKDYFDVKDEIVTGGTLGLKNCRCKANAELVDRMLKAGAIPLGITNAPEIGLAYETDNLIYGKTSNPYDLSRTAGGSSGGEAAIIAAGGSPIGLSSDLGGSIRLPAHFSGIAGIRPTVGRISCAGHIHIFTPGIRFFFVSVGPLARHVEDLIYALPFLSGLDWKDPLTQPVSLRNPDRVNIKNLKVAFFVDNKISSPTSDTEETIRKAVACLEKYAKKVKEVLPEPVKQSFDLMNSVFGFAGSDAVVKKLKSMGTDTLHSLTEAFIAKFPKEPYTIMQIAKFFEDWLSFKSQMNHFMEDYDVLISPVQSTPAMKHGTSVTDENYRGFSYVMTHSLTGWPAVVVRCGTSKEGLPIGIQIAAKAWREDVALAVALYLEKAMGGWQKSDL